MGAIVVGSQLHGARKLLKSAGAVAKLEIGLPQLVMRLGETGVQLHRIGILDGGFAVLPLVEIAVPTLQKFLFTHVGITRAPREQRSDEEPNEKEANEYRTAHVFSKAGATAYVITNFWTLYQGTRMPALNKVTRVIRGGTPTLSPRQTKGQGTGSPARSKTEFTAKYGWTLQYPHFR